MNAIKVLAAGACAALLLPLIVSQAAAQSQRTPPGGQSRTAAVETCEELGERVAPFHPQTRQRIIRDCRTERERRAKQQRIG